MEIVTHWLSAFIYEAQSSKMKKVFIACIIICIITAFTPKKITWVAIGDSITYLNEHPDETGNRVTKGYMTRVAEMLPYIRYVNQGHNGWTSGGIAENFDKLGVVKADVYSVFLGTNDWWQGRPIGTFADYEHNTGNQTVYGSFRIIINKIRSLNEAARIILITPMQRGDFVYIGNMKNNAYGSYKEKNGQQLSQFAEAILQIGKKEKIPVADLFNRSGITQKHMVKYKRLKDPQTGIYKSYSYPAYVGIPFDPATDEYPYPADAADMTYDGLHPSDKGNAVIAGMLAKQLKKYR